MKKEMMIIFLFALMASQLILAQEEGNIPSGEELKGITKDIGEQLKNENFFANSSFQNQIDIPDFLEVPVEVIFGIPRGEDVGVEKLIVIIALFISFLVLIYGIFEFMPFIEGKWLKFFASLIVTILMTMTGAIFYLIETLFHFINFFNWIDKLGKWKIAVSIVLIGLIFLAFKFVINLFKGKIKEEEDNVVVDELKILKGVAEANAEAVDKLSEDK